MHSRIMKNEARLIYAFVLSEPLLDRKITRPLVSERNLECSNGIVRFMEHLYRLIKIDAFFEKKIEN